MSETVTTETTKTDRFGNRLDPRVGYARGDIIKGEIEEVARQKHAHAAMRARFAQGGDDTLFNLTGLIRGFPYKPGDDEGMRSYVHFHARSDGELERLGIERLGGSPEKHDAFLANRVTAGTLAVMLTLLKPGDRVLSLVAADRSHPSIRQGVTVAGGVFEETVGLAAFEERIAAGPNPAMVVVTTISPSKHHIPEPEISRAIALGRKVGATVMLDDAHMAARISIYDEAPGLALDPDLTIWSLDKHTPGPRSGFLAGERGLIEKIRARAMALGLEAQLGSYVAGLRAVEAFDTAPIREAHHLADALVEGLRGAFGDRVYKAGAGAAISGEDFLGIALERSNGGSTGLVPLEAIAYASMLLLQRHGGVTIPAAGMPGSACTYRLMMYPDGLRFGHDKLVDATSEVMDELVAALQAPERVRETLLGG